RRGLHSFPTRRSSDLEFRQMTAGPFIVRNRTRGSTLGCDVRLADTPGARRIGLLRHDKLNTGQGLWIYPTQAIHTFGMRFPIDVDRKSTRLNSSHVAI